MGIAETIALVLGASWASGINLYAAMAALGLMGATGAVVLPPELAILMHPMVIVAACVMYAVEFFADKVPGVDTGWDTVHSFIRIPAGAVLAAAAMGPDSGLAMQVAAGAAGGGMATLAHATKAGSRVLINTSPEPFSNWAASIAEDVAVIGGIWLALTNPELFLALLAIFVVAAAWLLPKIWRGIRRVFRWLFRTPDRRPASETEEGRSQRSGAGFDLTGGTGSSLPPSDSTER